MYNKFFQLEEKNFLGRLRPPAPPCYGHGPDFKRYLLTFSATVLLRNAYK